MCAAQSSLLAGGFAVNEPAQAWGASLAPWGAWLTLCRPRWAAFSCCCKGSFKCRLRVVTGSARAVVPRPDCHQLRRWLVVSLRCADLFSQPKRTKVVSGCRS